MNLLNKMERKFGKYAIVDLYLYIIIIYGAGGVLGLISTEFYYSYMTLDVGKILHGQIWRLFTFIAAPVSISGFGIIWTMLKMYMFYLFGRSLIDAWGDFRFNVYIFSGYFFIVISAFLLYFISGIVLGYHIPFYAAGMDYVYQSMFFAIAAIYPNTVFFVSFIIPIKAKWLAIFDGVLLLIEMIDYVKLSLQSPLYWSYPVALLAAMLNFIIFFFATRNFKRISTRERRRKAEFRRKVRSAEPVTHRCAVCGRTPADNPELEFRFCSKCKGNYEYCNEHLFTHEHIK